MVVRRRWMMSEREVGLAPRQVEQARVGHELDGDARVGLDEFGEHRREHVHAEPVGRRDAQLALQRLTLPGQLALEGDGFFLHALRVRQQRGALVGEGEALGAALEQRMAHVVLQRAQAPSHRRLALAGEPGGAIERSRAGDREEDPDVAPLHACLYKSEWPSCNRVNLHARVKSKE